MKHKGPEVCLVVCLASLLAGCIACQQRSERRMPPVAAKELCTRLWSDYIETAKTLDPRRVAAWFTKDAVLIYPDMQELRSRDSLQAFFIKAFPGTKVLEMTFALVHFDVIGPRAYTFVTINELEQEGTNPPVHALARCGVIWERQADNSWQISHFLVNYMSLAASEVAQVTAPEAAIRKGDEAWAKAIASKSLEGTIASYDPEALTAGSAMPPAQGLAAVRGMWAEVLAQKGFSLTWKTEKIAVTESGTMAYSTGTWRRTNPNATSPYLAVWRKLQDGQWKVLVDAAWYSGHQK